MKRFLKTALGGIALAAALSGTASAAIIEVNANISSDTRWTRDNVYVITGIRFVLPGAVLTIEPGTLIRAPKDTLTSGVNTPGTLAVARGGKVIGNATVDDPIIFTSIDDPYVPGGSKTIPTKVLTNTVVVQNYATNGPATTNAFAYSKESGGLLILGRTPIGYDNDGIAPLLKWNAGLTDLDSGSDTLSLPTSTVGKPQGNGVGFALIEGLSLTSITIGTPFDSDGGFPLPATTNFQPGVYGGVAQTDSSGIFRFWSHRYGGFNISANNEINGVTMGGVGSGTVMEWQEVAQNADDGFEWFGGYVNARYLMSVFNGDDSFDGDQGFSGNLQHLFAINDNESYTRHASYGGLSIGRNTFAVSDKMVEWDGSEPDNQGVTPQTNAFAANFTFIGNKGANVTPAASDSAIHLLKSASGQWFRGVSEDIHGPIMLGGGGSNGTADVLDLIYFNFGSTSSTLATGQSFAGTEATIAQIRGKAHATKFGLDPRLVDDTNPASVARDLSLPALTNEGTGLGFWSPVRHRGAMRDNNWLFGWTWAHAVELTPTTNVDRPVLTIALDGVNPTITFVSDEDETVGADEVVYVVERSTDGGKIFAPFVAVQDGGTGDTDTLDNSSITVKDTGTTFAGSAVLYRVIPQ